MSEIKVLNRFDKDLQYYEINDNYLVINIMRPTIFGNPFNMKDKSDSERARVIAEFRAYLWKDIKAEGKLCNELRKLAEIKDKVIIIVCCCKPKACHGDVLKSCIEWMQKEGHK